MSLLPYLVAQLEAQRRASNPYLMMSLEPEVLAMIGPQYSREYATVNNPWKMSSLYQDGSTIKGDSQKFQINLDVHHFAPEEISVKAVEGFVVIEAGHEEKKDEHGWVSRRFVRRYPLPDGCNPDTVLSRLSSDGVLTVTAPLETPQVSNERVVPIIQTGPVKTQPESSRTEVGGGESMVKIHTENGQ